MRKLYINKSLSNRYQLSKIRREKAGLKETEKQEGKIKLKESPKKPYITDLSQDA